MKTYGIPVKTNHTIEEYKYGILDKNNHIWYDIKGSSEIPETDYNDFIKCYIIKECEINDIHLEIIKNIKI